MYVSNRQTTNQTENVLLKKEKKNNSSVVDSILRPQIVRDVMAILFTPYDDEHISFAFSYVVNNIKHRTHEARFFLRFFSARGLFVFSYITTKRDVINLCPV